MSSDETEDVYVRHVRTAAAHLTLPAYQTSGSSGLDLAADCDPPILINPGERALIPTGWAIELPPWLEAQVRPRSGLALRHGVTVLNSPGTIDSDYRGEIQVLLINFGSEPFLVRSGQRIAQLVVAPITRVRVTTTSVLSESGRGSGGFGHTGIESPLPSGGNS